MSILGTINNAEAAKRCARRGTPYVLWNRKETGDLSLINRIPRLGPKTPAGWERVDSWTVSEDYHAGTLASIDAVLQTAKATLGFGFVDDLLVVYKPLPEAHEPERAEW